MKNKFCIFYLFLFQSVLMFGQVPEIEWQNNIGGFSTDNLYSVNQTMDGGYILGGASSSGISGDKTQPFVGGYDYWVLKLDSLGNIEWQKTIGGNDDDWLYCIEQTSDEGFILAGTSESNISGNKTENNLGGTDFWIIKLNSVGNILWQNTIGGNVDDGGWQMKIHQTYDGGYIIGSFSYSGVSGDKTETNLGSADYWVVKLNSLGNLDWQNTIGGDATDVLYSIEQTFDGGYILGGTSLSGISGDKTEPSIDGGFGNTNDYWVIKLDNLGAIQWQNTIGGNATDGLQSITVSNDGGYILGGSSSSAISGDKTENRIGVAGTTDYWIVKIDDLGNILWQNTIGGNSSEVLFDIIPTFGNNYILAGYSNSGVSGDKTESSYGGNDYWVVKVDSLGNIDWDKTLGGSGYDNLYDIYQTDDSGYILGGWSGSNISGNKTENTNGDVDYWTVKLLPDEDCFPITFYADADEDGFGNNLISTDACFAPFGYVLDNTDCNDANNIINPSIIEICNAIDDNCNFLIDEGLALNTYYLDADNDGYGNILFPIAICSGDSPLGYVDDSSDCDDGNNLIHEPILYYADIDGDFFGDELNSEFFCSILSPAGFVVNNLDCDDLNIFVNPVSNEICNNLDDNCNAEIDEGLIFQTLFFDLDGDTYGNPFIDTITCLFGITGYVTTSADCNDLVAEINPSAIEICNDIDDNCNFTIDEGLTVNTYYVDADGDDFGDPEILINSCLVEIIGYVSDSTDCNDANNLINPLSNEICNNIDDNCNIEIDEGIPTQTLFIDADDDNYGNPVIDSITCFFEIDGYVSDSTDCNDSNPLIYPGAPEILNGFDDDCDELTDENLAINNSILDAIKIYPNPATDILQIDYSGNETGTIQILNIAGENIYSDKLISHLNINIQNLPAGIYLLKITSTENLGVFNFVKE